jgi:hypothetical protein
MSERKIPTNAQARDGTVMISAVALALNDPSITLVERLQRCASLAAPIEDGIVVVDSSADVFDVVAAPPLPQVPPLSPGLA